MKKLDTIETLFILIYFTEQITLVLLYSFSRDLIGVWIGIFPIIFLSTMAIEKVLLKADFQKKIEGLEEKSSEKSQEKELKEFKSIYFKLKKKK